MDRKLQKIVMKEKFSNLLLDSSFISFLFPRKTKIKQN